MARVKIKWSSEFMMSHEGRPAAGPASEPRVDVLPPSDMVTTQNLRERFHNDEASVCVCLGTEEPKSLTERRGASHSVHTSGLRTQNQLLPPRKLLSDSEF